MTKNNLLCIVFSTLCFSSASIHTMLFDSDDDNDIERHCKRADSTDKAERDQALDQIFDALEKRRIKQENDPKKWGALTFAHLAHSDYQDAKELADDLAKGEINLLYGNDYPKNRKRIAKAILCGVYHEKFVHAASAHNDYYGWHHLISWKAEIKARHGIDISTVKIGDRLNKESPLFKLTSLETIQLLVEKGKFSIEETDAIFKGTMAHRACHYDRSPEILAYCLAQYPEAIRSVDHALRTPLITLCKYGLNEVLESKYLSDALTKLAILKEYGANLYSVDKGGNTARSIIREKIVEYRKRIKEDNVYADEMQKDLDALSTFADHLYTKQPKEKL